MRSLNSRSVALSSALALSLTGACGEDTSKEFATGSLAAAPPSANTTAGHLAPAATLPQLVSMTPVVSPVSSGSASAAGGAQTGGGGAQPAGVPSSAPGMGSGGAPAGVGGGTSTAAGSPSAAGRDAAAGRPSVESPGGARGVEAGGASPEEAAGAASMPEVGEPNMSVNAPDNELIGWASTAGCGESGTTGGGTAPEVMVTTSAQLKEALTSGGAKVIVLSGKVDSPGKLSGVEDKTLIGTSDAEVSGEFGLEGASNVIFKNVLFKNTNDGVKKDTFEMSGSSCIWFDHCEFVDGTDGNLDIVRGSDLVTVSWSKFYYTFGHGHMLSNLCGNKQPSPADVGKVNITFHHNLWGAGCRSRQPFVRYGKVHVFNNLYSYTEISGGGGSNYAVGNGIDSKLLVENNFFENVGKAHARLADNGTGEVVARGNEYVNTGNEVPTDGAAFEPPYEYSLTPAAQAKADVLAGAGRQ